MEAVFILLLGLRQYPIEFNRKGRTSTMTRFKQHYEEWLQENLDKEKNPRRRELLTKGLGHGTVEFLRSVWFPAVGNLNHLLPEWEVRDLSMNQNSVNSWSSLLLGSLSPPTYLPPYLG